MRLELVHPMVVGFPISFLLVGLLLRLVAFFLRKNHLYKVVLIASWLTMSLGILSGIVAVFTGEVAHDIVHSKLCNHKILDYHERIAIVTLSIFAIALLLDRERKIHRFLGYAGVILYWIAPVFLVLTGYFGGKLVFEQGAAVENTCKGRTENNTPHPASKKP